MTSLVSASHHDEPDGPLSGPGQPIAIIDDSEAAAVLLKPPRLEILQALRRPDSAAGLSRKLGVPRQRLSYHLAELEKRGLVELVEERKRGNCMERVLRARARYFLVGPSVLGTLAADRPERMQDRFSWSYLVARVAKALRDLSLLRRGADADGKRLPTLTLETRVRFAGPKALNSFSEELSNALAALIAEYHDESSENGRMFSFFMGAYPTPKHVPGREPSSDQEAES